MSAPIITPDDLGTYLGNPSIDADRALAVITLAQTLCEAVISPLPAGAEAVVTVVAARAYTNPTNTQSEGAGPFTVGFAPMSGGLWLTRNDKATLRRLGGGGGAFTIDTIPDGAATNLPPWDTGVVGWPAL